MFCVKERGGLPSREEFWAKSNPKRMEDKPHVRIFMEGDLKHGGSNGERPLSRERGS